MFKSLKSRKFSAMLLAMTLLVNFFVFSGIMTKPVEASSPNLNEPEIIVRENTNYFVLLFDEDVEIVGTGATNLRGNLFRTSSDASQPMPIEMFLATRIGDGTYDHYFAPSTIEFVDNRALICTFNAAAMQENFDSHPNFLRYQDLTTLC